MTLLGEKERKLWNDIIKRAKNPVKKRTIPQGWLFCAEAKAGAGSNFVTELGDFARAKRVCFHE